MRQVLRQLGVGLATPNPNLPNSPERTLTYPNPTPNQIPLTLPQTRYPGYCGSVVAALQRLDFASVRGRVRAGVGLGSGLGLGLGWVKGCS